MIDILEIIAGMLGIISATALLILIYFLFSVIYKFSKILTFASVCGASCELYIAIRLLIKYDFLNIVNWPFFILGYLILILIEFFSIQYFIKKYDPFCQRKNNELQTQTE